MVIVHSVNGMISMLHPTPDSIREGRSWDTLILASSSFPDSTEEGIFFRTLKTLLEFQQQAIHIRLWESSSSHVVHTLLIWAAINLENAKKLYEKRAKGLESSGIFANLGVEWSGRCNSQQHM